jgi:Fe-S cluster assembly iron-binding protein IscA
MVSEMVEVTTRAKERLRSTWQARVNKPGITLRLKRFAPGQLGVVADRRREGDQVVEHEGTTILLIDETLVDSLAGATIDCREYPEGSRLVITRFRRQREAA